MYSNSNINTFRLQILISAQNIKNPVC